MVDYLKWQFIEILPYCSNRRMKKSTEISIFSEEYNKIKQTQEV